MRVVNGYVAGYDDYMLINSYLTFLLFDIQLLQLTLSDESLKPRPQCILDSCKQPSQIPVDSAFVRLPHFFKGGKKIKKTRIILSSKRLYNYFIQHGKMKALGRSYDDGGSKNGIKH